MNEIVEKILDVIIVILIVALIVFFIWLVIFVGTEAKNGKNAEYIAHCNKNIYYIDYYEIHNDEIWATDVEGKRIIFPKNNTIIEENN